jgi:hypothetical protein
MPINTRQKVKAILLGIASTSKDETNILEATKQLAYLLDGDKPVRRRRKRTDDSKETLFGPKT